MAIPNSKNIFEKIFIEFLCTAFHNTSFVNHVTVVIRNIKDIAKLRGSEDLWEVSKLHDRESSFPVVFPSLVLIFRKL